MKVSGVVSGVVRRVFVVAAAGVAVAGGAACLEPLFIGAATQGQGWPAACGCRAPALRSLCGIGSER